MKKIIVASVLAVVLAGCGTTKNTASNPPLKSEREYAEQQEAYAQWLVKSGQATDITAARAQAAATTNQEWAAAANAEQQKQSDESIAGALDKMKRDKN